MLTLRCEDPGHRLASAPYFRLVGGSLRAGPGDVEVGSYGRGAWQVAGQASLTLTAEGPAAVRFEQGGTHGPFPSVQLFGEGLWYGANAERLLASYDEVKRVWYSYAERRHFTTVVLQAP